MKAVEDATGRVQAVLKLISKTCKRCRTTIRHFRETSSLPPQPPPQP